MTMRWMTWTLLAGCAATPTELLDTAPPPRGTLHLYVPTAAIAGEPTQVSVGDALPGTRVFLAAGRQGTGAGPCPPALHGGCIDLLGPQLIASALANSNGSVTFDFTLPDDVGPNAVWMQAATADEVSESVEVRPQPFSWGDDVDCAYVCGNRPTNSGWCWTDAISPQCSRNGCVDECIDWCQALAPDLSITERNAFAVCAANNAVCFQSIEQCVASGAATEAWLQPEIDAVSDADGDGRWEPGEALTLDVSLSSFGLPFFDYPMLQLRVRPPVVPVTDPDMVWFGIDSGDTYTHSYTITAPANLPPGTHLELVLTATELHCDSAVAPGCVDPNESRRSITIQ